MTARAVLVGFATRPMATLVRQWNWKSAVLSSIVRGGLFFAANLSAGPDAARAAFVTELCYRAVTAGFYGAMTQGFRRVEPAWLASLVAMALLPASGHALEWLVHWMRGTPNLAASVGLSLAMTALSTAFNLYAMRRGALIVGDGSRTLAADLASLPALMAAFTRDIMTTATGVARDLPAWWRWPRRRGVSVGGWAP